MTDLHDLLILQQHDTAADQLRHRRATIPERALVTGLDDEIRRLALELSGAQAERDALGASQARLEADVAACEDKRRTLERRLAATSVPREAQTMSGEIDGLKARQSALEDQLLEIMEALETLDERLRRGQAERATLEDRQKVGKASLAEAEASIDLELAAEVAARLDSLRPIAKPLLDRYERLRAHLGGVAVATLDGPRCTGCNLTLPTIELERVRAAAPDVIIECEQCGRILVR